METLEKYIVEQALILIPALLIIGRALKGIPRYPDWLIPWTLLPLGCAGACLLMGPSANALVQGILVAGAAVYGHQLWKQAARKAE